MGFDALYKPNQLTGLLKVFVPSIILSDTSASISELKKLTATASACDGPSFFDLCGDVH